MQFFLKLLRFHARIRRCIRDTRSLPRATRTLPGHACAASRSAESLVERRGSCKSRSAVATERNDHAKEGTQRGAAIAAPPCMFFIRIGIGFTSLCKRPIPRRRCGRCVKRPWSPLRPLSPDSRSAPSRSLQDNPAPASPAFRNIRCRSIRRRRRRTSPFRCISSRCRHT